MTEVTGVIDLLRAPEPASKTHLVVEIGPGANPRKITQGERYLGIESRADLISLQNQGVHGLLEDPLETARRKMEQSAPATGSEFDVREGNGKNTGLDVDSVDEVYMANVFGSVLHPTRDDIEAAGLIEEAVRILKKEGGVFRIIENVTPADRERLVSLLEEKGLMQVNKRDEANEERVLRYNDRGLRTPKSYMLEYAFPALGVKSS